MTGMTELTIGDEELLVHVFVVLDEFTGDRPYQRLRELWENCRPLMGRAIVGTDLPVHLPADAAELPDGFVAEAVIAGQESVGGDCQAVLRRRHDVLNLSIAFAAVGGSRSGAWADFERQWEGLLAGFEDALVGEVRIYYGKVPESDDLPLTASTGLADAARRSLPPVPEQPGWQTTGITTTAGFPVWEISPRDDSRTLRRILVLTPEQHDARLSAWVWSAGHPGAPPLAGYLLHMAKIRYQMRVWDRGKSLRGLRARAADSFARIRAGSDDQDPGLRDVELDVASALAALLTMKQTVEIATHNMMLNLADAVPAGQGHDMFGDDRALAEIFPAQLDDEIAYLRADQDLLREAREITAVRSPARTRSVSVSPIRTSEPTIGILTAMPLEFHAMRSLLDDVQEATLPLDHARYVRGVLPSLDPDSPHHVVLAQTGATGTNPAADAATNMARSFPTVTGLIMTGIAAGVPDPRDPQRHVRLGDIVVASWGIVEYEHVVVREGEGVELRETFPRPWQKLCRGADRLEADEEEDLRPWEQWLDVSATPSLARYARPSDDTDLLAPGPDGVRPRHPRRSASKHRAGWPKVHQGRIGSANVSLRDGRIRDQLAAQYGLRAFEMEGAGVGTSAFLNDRHWFMVRGISDYADKSFGTPWRRYAALAAAAYVRALLAVSQPEPLSHRSGEQSNVL
ncbi:nucleoside phosphorylase [Kibdelosporangium banguiense]|uniref:Nucleoside phosphorylase n=1 Tax=Kibdelosporangium banguiense TaxID=1365924 RepID=A0ABS4TQF4_9PSEU|nr:CATRA conflict system CASPASE/TPR repeat-associated protein [Kibdelosporangium banguiense]MBP2326641.1 nucleoside phosphorylase [Kibdelosporangium banguiense]